MVLMPRVVVVPTDGETMTVDAEVADASRREASSSGLGLFPPPLVLGMALRGACMYALYSAMSRNNVVEVVLVVLPSHKELALPDRKYAAFPRDRRQV